MLASILLRSLGPKTHAGPSFLLRKRFGFDRFDKLFGFDLNPPLVVEAQTAYLKGANFPRTKGGALRISPPGHSSLREFSLLA